MTRSSAEPTTAFVTSLDGTRIAYDRLGRGPAVILVGGAFSYRRYPRSVELAELLAAEGFTVFNYDRRGRGDSGDTAPYAVDREIEDLDALIHAAGGRAAVWGQSSGGMLALRAAAAGLAIDSLAVFEPPLRIDQDGAPPPDFATRLDAMVAADRRGQAVRYFMTKGLGAPGVFVAMLRLARPIWSRLTAVAHTLPYDVAVMGDTVTGKPPAPEEWQAVSTPTLVLTGAKSPQRTRAAGQALAEALPDAHHQVLEGQSYNIKIRPLVPILRDHLHSTRA